MKKTIPLVFFTLLLTFCSEEKKLLRLASNAVSRSDFDKAVSYYDKVIQKDETSFYGNAGKGIVLSEFMERHEQAIPYLEKALKNSPKKSKPIVNRDLGRSYHFIGNYERALYYYQKTDNNPDFSDYDEFLTKRIADCRYAIEHPKVALPENQLVKNVGNTVNSDMPEYTPVVADGKLLFSSKRQDDPKEKKNGFDGRYYENIYVSALNADGTYSKPEIYKLPLTRMERKRGESIMSASPDGKKLFLFKGGKIFEANVNDLQSKPEMLDDNINFANIHNHASLSPDGNTLFFSAVSEKEGKGGSDIYMATKTGDGKWSDPKILGDGVNTTYDEDSPYLSDNGTLFFSSNGHPGYGGFDVYKSKETGGSWSKAENLGQPINSAGDDIYFVLQNGTSNGYYASARTGGYGDLDIYKVHYLSNEVLPCKQTDILTINTQADPTNPLLYNVELAVPEQYKNNVRQYAWDLNGEPLVQTSDKFQHTFKKADTYKLTAKIVVYCDTCPTLIGLCSEKQLAVENKTTRDPKTLTPVDQANTGLANNNPNEGKGKTKKDKNSKSKGKNKSGSNEESEMADGSQNNSSMADNNSGSNSGKSGKNKNAAGTGAEPKNGNSEGNSDEGNSSNLTSGSGAVLNESQLKGLNWNTNAMLFELNDFNLNEDTKAVLDQNIEVLKNKSNLRVTINGYADSRGSEALNKNLSYKRAASIKQYLVSKGITSKRIKSTNGMGETNLLNNCSDGVECAEAQHQQNRRVQIDITEGPVKSPGSITQK